MREEYVAWLEDGHLDAVLKGGASRAALVVLDGDEAPFRVQSKYRFPSREAYKDYERLVAPALRAAGISGFATRGVTFERSLGVVRWNKD
jgi:Domain of unknown function (DUF4286)